MINMRSQAFWLVDRYLNGGAVGTHLGDIQLMMAVTAEAERRRAIALRSLLQHAIETTDFYKNLDTLAPLEQFPVVDKSIIRENFDSILSRSFHRSALHVASTSGSTGTPFVVLQSEDKRRRANAEGIYFGLAAGFEFGRKLFYLKIWSDRNRKGLLKQKMQNIVPIEILHFQAGDVPALIRKINTSGRSSGLVAYSSGLDVVARALDKSKRPNELDIRRGALSSIIAQSETFMPETRESLYSHFGFYPVGRYGAEEVGIIAQQSQGPGEEYVVNRASIWMEVLDLTSDKPASPGELGRIVITDLFSHSMPIVRYDTGDLGRFRVMPNGERLDSSALEVIEGRRLDRIYDSSDRPVSSYVIYKVFWKYPEIRQFQLVQEGRAKYCLKVNVDRPFNRAGELTADYLDHLGAGANFTIEYVDDVPQLSSGKRRQVVSHYQPHRP